MRWLRIALAALILAGGFFAAQVFAEHLVSLPAQEPGAQDYRFRVAAIMPTSEDGYWREMRSGMREAAGRFQVGLEFVGPRYPNPEYTADRFDQAIAAKVDGIVCHVEDTPPIVAAIRRAERAGIPVVTVGTDLPESGRRAHVGPDPFYLGYEVGRTLRIAPGSARIVVILDGVSARPDSAQGMYLTGLRRAISPHPDLQLVRVIYAPPGVFGAEIAVQRLLAAGERIDVICCASPRDTLGAAKVLREQARGHRAILIGAGLLPEILQLLRQKMLRATVASYPFAMGCDAIGLLATIMGGGVHPQSISSGAQVFRPEDADDLLRELHTAEVGDDG